MIPVEIFRFFWRWSLVYSCRFENNKKISWGFVLFPSDEANFFVQSEKRQFLQMFTTLLKIKRNQVSTEELIISSELLKKIGANVGKYLDTK